MERQGKTSLEFEDPELCVFISEANPDRLHQFLAHLERATNGQPLKPVQSVKNVQQSFTAIGNRQTKMRILSNQDYPQRSSSHGFPSTLQLLHLNRIGLQAVDLRWYLFTLPAKTAHHSIHFPGSIFNRYVSFHWRTTSLASIGTRYHGVDSAQFLDCNNCRNWTSAEIP
jgi:hypothetical protein